MVSQINLGGVFAAAFGPVYGDGTLHRATIARGAGGTRTPAFADAAIKGQVDQVSEAARAAGQYQDRQQRLLVLQSGVSPAPTTKDQITLGGIRWAVASVESDPASTHWVVRGAPA